MERQVCFAGWISGGMDRFYSALDINALTSLSETFPYALTEGARFHLATVATAVGGIPCLIDQNVNGYLIQPGDWQTLGAHLAALGMTTICAAGWGKSSMKRPPPGFPSRRPCPPSCRSTHPSSGATGAAPPPGTAVVICGAYGRGNAGDDAILEAILQEMRSIDPDMPMTGPSARTPGPPA